MRRLPEDVRTARSLYAEYQRLEKRANMPGIAPAERDYTLKMVASTKARINFDLLTSKKKFKEEYEYGSEER